MKKIYSLKNIIIIVFVTLLLTLLSSTSSHAMLQANPTTHARPASKVGSTWLTEIRQMETAGQTMGLTETLNGLEATSDNNIDVHMMLPTEYGAVAILSASGYGNIGKLRDEKNAQKRTTTGNSTGVYFTGDRWELLAENGENWYGKYTTIDQGWKLLTTTSSWHGGGTLAGQWGWVKDEGNYWYGSPAPRIAGGYGIFGAGLHYSLFSQTGRRSWNAWNNGVEYGVPLDLRSSSYISRGSATS